MARAFAVECEIFARMASRRDAFGAFDPFHRGKLPNFTRDRRFPHGGAERVLRKEMLEVGEQQFLMLLLVMDAEGDKGAGRGREIGQRGLQDRKSTRLNSSH